MEETAIEYIIVGESLFLVVKYFKEVVETPHENEYALKLRVYRITDKNELKNCEIVLNT